MDVVHAHLAKLDSRFENLPRKEEGAARQDVNRQDLGAPLFGPETEITIIASNVQTTFAAQIHW